MNDDPQSSRDDVVPGERFAPVPRPTRMGRWLFASLGVFFVGLGAVGAVLPGLPTTIFLIGATWCFARSFPSLSNRILDTRLFRPFRAWLVPGGRVSKRSKITALLAMWAAITLTVHLLLAGDDPQWILAGVIAALGFIGTWFIIRHGRHGRRRERPHAPPKQASA